ncbi:Uncharacterised protein [Mycobacteroides abscessus subsp. abscessus]|nr:Uncharacterised protein [Mycobacteroides abscessus subsp. abscessus]SKU51271.1 Uncharacterised protein [Mycobacteroides abscessus subsp. abscessus]
MKTEKKADVSSVDGSRPASSQRCRSTVSLCGISSSELSRFRWSAYLTAKPKVFFSPLPPIMIGMFGRSRGSLSADSVR